MGRLHFALPTGTRDLVLDMAKFEQDAGDSYFYPFDSEGLTQRVWNLTNKREFRELLEIEALSEMMDHIFSAPHTTSFSPQ